MQPLPEGSSLAPQLMLASFYFCQSTRLLGLPFQALPSLSDACSILTRTNICFILLPSVVIAMPVLGEQQLHLQINLPYYYTRLQRNRKAPNFWVLPLCILPPVRNLTAGNDIISINSVLLTSPKICISGSYLYSYAFPCYQCPFTASDSTRVKFIKTERKQ
jgi:hypothetical protein